MSTTDIGTSTGQLPPPPSPRTRHGVPDSDAIGTPEGAADAAVSPEPADGPHVGSGPVVRTWVAGVIGLGLLIFAGWWSTRTASASKDWGQVTIFLAMFALMVIAGLLLIPALQKAWGWLKGNTKNLTVAVVIAALFVAVVAGLVAAAGHASADPASECRNWQQYKKQQWAKQTGRPISQSPYFACPAPPPPPIQTTVPPTTWQPGQGEEPGDTANPGAVPGQENGPQTSVNNQVPSGNPTVTAPGHPARTPNQVPVPPVATSDVPAPTGQRPDTSPAQPTTTAVTPTTTTTPGAQPEGTATNTDESPIVTLSPTQRSTGSGEYSLAFNQPDGSGVSPVVPAAMLAAAATLGVVTIRRNNARTALSKVRLTEGVSPLDTLAQGYLEGTVGPSDLVLMLNPTAPREYVFDEDVPPGGRIVVNPDGSATVYDAAGNPVKTIAKPWAYDALGRPQPTWYTVNEDGNLVQHIDPRDDAFYPILADPTEGAVGSGAAAGAGAIGPTPAPSQPNIGDGVYYHPSDNASAAGGAQADAGSSTEHNPLKVEPVFFPNNPSEPNVDYNGLPDMTGRKPGDEWTVVTGDGRKIEYSIPFGNGTDSVDATYINERGVRETARIVRTDNGYRRWAEDAAGRSEFIDSKNGEESVEWTYANPSDSGDFSDDTVWEGEITNNYRNVEVEGNDGSSYLQSQQDDGDFNNSLTRSDGTRFDSKTDVSPAGNTVETVGMVDPSGRYIDLDPDSVALNPGIYEGSTFKSGDGSVWRWGRGPGSVGWGWHTGTPGDDVWMTRNPDGVTKIYYKDNGSPKRPDWYYMIEIDRGGNWDGKTHQTPDPGQAVEDPLGPYILDLAPLPVKTKSLKIAKHLVDEFLDYANPPSDKSQPVTAPPYRNPTLWSPGRPGDSGANARGHYTGDDGTGKPRAAHGSEFPQYASPTAYNRAAAAIARDPSSGFLRYQRSNGDWLYYNPRTNTFISTDSNGVPRTMFKPSPGMAYWEQQIAAGNGR